MVNKKILQPIATFFLLGLLFSTNITAQEMWPPALPTANKNGVATISTPDLLRVPTAVQNILDSNAAAKLTLATQCCA
jgi:hypothetical protein